MKQETLKKLTIFAAIFYVLLIIKNYWVSDDAYIAFRSIEQLFAGNGPNWNIHERLQVYTSPLWFYLSSLVRIFSPYQYENTVLLSIALNIGCIFFLSKLFNNSKQWILCLLFLVASKSFFDFTVSGLENPLGYFLVSLFLWVYFKFQNAVSLEKKEKHLFTLSILLGIFLVYRHDMATLIFPICLSLFLFNLRAHSKKFWIKAIVVASLPLALWSLFAVIYYGFPFPNSAYSKLGTDFTLLHRLEKGFNYTYATIYSDYLLPIVILLALILSWKNKKLRPLFFGISINLLYILFSGADYMRGRFFTYSYLISTVILVCESYKWEMFQFKFKNLHLRQYGSLSAVLVIFLLANPLSVVRMPLVYINRNFIFEISDEKGWNHKDTGIYAYIKNFDKDIFPFVKDVKTGIEMRSNPTKAFIIGNLGKVGYYAPLDTILVDVWALADPFLARLPAVSSRPGHSLRVIPEDYKYSLRQRQNLIHDENLHNFYEKMRIITQSDRLFTTERFKTIINMNLHKYDHYLDFIRSYVKNTPAKRFETIGDLYMR